MRKLLLPLLLLYILPLQAQNARYITDLAALNTLLQKTASYKAQIKGHRLAEYMGLYHRLAADTLGSSTTYTDFYKLAQLFFPIKDNHLGFYQIADYSHFKSKATIEQFVKTKAFADYPKLSVNTDSLQAVLASKPDSSIDGIYHYDKFYKVGLFKSGAKEYTGVVVASDINLWTVGQIAMLLFEYEPNSYKAIYSHPLTKSFSLITNEKYRNLSLVNSYFYNSYTQNLYSKRPQAVDHVDLARNASKFELQQIDPATQYLRIRTFQVNQATAARSSQFYDSIKNAITSANLILDLRNNEGGAKKATKNYYKLIKKYSKKGHVYVLINNGTLSQAEIFTLRLKKLKNVTTIGQTTKGMLAYGSNFGRREKLPSGLFEMYPTDMKGNAKLLRFENAGIEPDTYLNNDTDWIEQVVAIIEKR
jgi:hypothetical protein